MGKYKHKSANYKGTHGMRKVLIRRDGSLCHYCEAQMSLTNRDEDPEPQTMTLEHVVPVSAGGDDHVTNLVLACYECNQKFGDELIKCVCNFCASARSVHNIINLSKE